MNKDAYYSVEYLRLEISPGESVEEIIEARKSRYRIIGKLYQEPQRIIRTETDKEKLVKMTEKE